MAKRPWDESKHDRDAGKFAPKGKGRPGKAKEQPKTGRDRSHEDEARRYESLGQSGQVRAMRDAVAKAGAMDPEVEAQAQKYESLGQHEQAKALREGHYNSPEQDPKSQPRPVAKLRQMGFAASTAYDSSHQALAALHKGGMDSLHHYGKKMQESLKAMKKDGARPEEIKEIRGSLVALSDALASGDKVGAHKALLGLQHGFYAAHAAMQNEFGPGAFPQHKFSPSGDKSSHQAAFERREGEKLAKTPFGTGAEGTRHAKRSPATGGAGMGGGERKPPAGGGGADGGVPPSGGESTGGGKATPGMYKAARWAAKSDRYWDVYDGDDPERHFELVHSALRKHAKNEPLTGEELQAMQEAARYSESSDHYQDMGGRMSAWGKARQEAHMLEMSFDEYVRFKAVRFNAEDISKLPERPTPEDFDKAIKMAENVKVEEWDHRFVDHEDIEPSENKEPDKQLIERYKEAAGTVPPIVVTKSGSNYKILDGHHRNAASRMAGHKGMWVVNVKKGTYK